MRKPRTRTVTVCCDECGTRYTVELPLRAYIAHVRGKELSADAWVARCVCGGEVGVRVGEVFRAAA